MEYRSLPVPDGLVGKRVDAALAALLGFSRSFAAEVIQGGGVTLDGQVLGKSDRLHADGWLEVSWAPKVGPQIIPVDLPELGIVYDDDEEPAEPDTDDEQQPPDKPDSPLAG